MRSECPWSLRFEDTILMMDADPVESVVMIDSMSVSGLPERRIPVLI